MEVDPQTKYLAEASLKLIEDIRAARIREAQNRNEAYLKITTGTLALSITFLAISGFDKISHGMTLIAAWAFLLVAIILTLVSYVFVERHFSQYEENIREWRKQGMNVTSLPLETSIWRTLTMWTNNLSYCFTIVGLIVMLIFGITNVMNIQQNNIGKQTKSDPGEIKKGAEPTISSPSLSDVVNIPIIPSQNTPSDSKK